MLIIGITGGTGCGKTTVVNQIIKELSGEEVTVISQDSYYKDLSYLSFSDRTKINFDPAVWDKVKYSIVLNGNYYKFTQNQAMMDFLLSTGDKILVEASPLDTIWGIGLGKDNEKAFNIASWRGKNLLGFALMEVRDELRKLYKNAHLLL